MDLSGPNHTVTLHGKGGATISGQKSLDRELHTLLQNSKFNLLILDIGSNDLDPVRHPHANLEHLAQALVGKAAALAFRYKLKVVLCLPIPRCEEQFPCSFNITSKFNSIVKDISASQNSVHVWAHKGLFKRDNRYLDKHGVHLNSKGTIKYFHSLRAAVRFFSSHSD